MIIVAYEERDRIFIIASTIIFRMNSVTFLHWGDIQIQSWGISGRDYNVSPLRVLTAVPFSGLAAGSIYQPETFYESLVPLNPKGHMAGVSFFGLHSKLAFRVIMQTNVFVASKSRWEGSGVSLLHLPLW